MNLNYPVHLESAEEGGFMVTFPDVPEAITQGDDEGEALLNAVDALETALEIYIDEGSDFPRASRGGRHCHAARLASFRVAARRRSGNAARR